MRLFSTKVLLLVLLASGAQGAWLPDYTNQKHYGGHRFYFNSGAADSGWGWWSNAESLGLQPFSNYFRTDKADTGTRGFFTSGVNRADSTDFVVGGAVSRSDSLGFALASGRLHVVPGTGPIYVIVDSLGVPVDTLARLGQANTWKAKQTFAGKCSLAAGGVLYSPTIISANDSISSRLAAVHLRTHTSGTSGLRDTMGSVVLDTLYYLVLTARCPFNIQIPETTAGEWAGFVKKGNKTIAKMDMEGNWYNAKGERQNGTAPPKKEYPLWLIGAGLGAVAIVISWRKRR
jgi:hypothetical protein